MRLLDRYVLRNFLVPFCYAFVGFLAIWLVFDLADNGQDFWEAKVPLWQVAAFYASQLPSIMIICLPVGLLLAVLYSLSHMSRTNELISMLTAGVSVPRILLPLFAAGLVASGVSLWLNYELAPHADAIKKNAFKALVRGKSKEARLEGMLFRNRRDLRSWFMESMPADYGTAHSQGVLEGLHIIQQDEEGNILKKYYARDMAYYPASREWELRRGKEVDLDIEGQMVGEQSWEVKRIADWSETPWRIAASNLSAANLSVPELRDYLRENGDFRDDQLAPYRTQLQERLSVPFACVLVIFIAAPLGIVFSRRGVLAGVASSIFIFAAMIFINSLCIALGKGGRIDPIAAAWVPVGVFGLIGLYLLRLKSQNRELPRFSVRRG